MEVPMIGIDPVIYDFLQKLALSFMIGILIGIEREHRRSDQIVFAGVRTFAMVCIGGMLATFASQMLGEWVLVISLILVSIISLGLMYRIYLENGKLGLTGALALFLTFILGMLVALDYYLFAIISGVVITFLLIEKKPLHSFAAHLSDDDILNAVQFLAVAFILYPLMPEELLFGIVDLKAAILIVVLVMTIGFISYVSLKRYGTRGGISYSGLFGGFVSSEATTGALAGMVKNRSSLVKALYIGILMSNVSMIISNTLIALIVDNSGRTMLLMLPPQLVMLATALVFVVTRRKSYDTMSEPLDIGSPFALKPAFRFGAIFTILMIMAALANQFFGDAGIYVTALGGVVSSSAVVASVGALAFKGTISYTVAAETAIIAGIISTLNKLTWIRLAGSKELFDTCRNSFILIAAMGVFSMLAWAYYVRYAGL